jgi:cation:H+ antiporter
VSVVPALLLFGLSLSVTLVAAGSFARRLDHLGVRFGLPEVLIGLLTALAADGPEISSALFALARGAHSVSVGVLVGSNAFNLAAMIGVSGLLAGSVVVARSELWLEAWTGGSITVLGALVLLGWLPAAAAAVLAVVVLVPYLLRVTAGARSADAPKAGPDDERPTHHLLGLIVLDVALIIAGSAGMVQTALTLSDHWGVSRSAVGVLILAPLTSIPNALTGIRLGRAGRTTALVGETFNSNTINLAVGVIVPALFVTLSATSTKGRLQLGWLVAMTVVTVALLARRRGLGRGGASVLIAMYLVFVAIELVAHGG